MAESTNSLDGLREKISNLCDVPIDGVINAPDADSLSQVFREVANHLSQLRLSK